MIWPAVEMHVNDIVMMSTAQSFVYLLWRRRVSAGSVSLASAVLICTHVSLYSSFAETLLSDIAVMLQKSMQRPIVVLEKRVSSGAQEPRASGDWSLSPFGLLAAKHTNITPFGVSPAQHEECTATVAMVVDQVC